MCEWRRFHGGVDDRCVSRRISDVGAQGRHQSAGNHWTWSGHKIQDCETNLILGSIRFHVASKSKARTVESSSADAGYSCNDKDTEKRFERVILGSCKSCTIGGRHGDLSRTWKARHCVQHPQSKSTLQSRKVRREARLKRVARHLLCEPELIWTFPYQKMPSKIGGENGRELDWSRQ